MDTRDLLLLLAETPGVSGHEGRVAERVAEVFLPLATDVRRDALGNVIARKAGADDAPARILLAAHMDEIGLMVKHVDERGFLRVAAVGGIDPRNIVAQEVTVHGREDVPGFIGLRPPHLTSPEERDKVFPLNDLYVDVGLSAARAKALVRVGDVVSLRRDVLSLQNNRLAGKAFDNRASVCVVYEVLKRLQGLRHGVDVFAVATVQEEVGLRGAITSTYGITPDLGIAIDVSFGDQPGVPAHESIKLGKGPALLLGPNAHPWVTAKLEEVAKAHGIAFQREVAGGPSGTDAWAMQVARAGVATAVLSIPLRNMHSTVETIDLADVREAGRLLAHFCAEIESASAKELIHGAR